MAEPRFEHVAKDYASFRPGYPDALFDALASLAPNRALAWDCATGSGQAARPLAARFERVIATDTSAELLAEAPRQERIDYRRADARSSGLESGSVALVTVANALHWFHGAEFESEVRRVVAPGGVIAAWCYGIAWVEPAVDALARHVHNVLVDPYWIAPNRIVERGYRDVSFPFARVSVAEFFADAVWDLPRYLAYLGTWSAVVKYRRDRGHDPLELLRPDFERAWGEPTKLRAVRWPLHLLVGRV
ncbi:MAG: class I SAM-dependent methyltransferase [Planctomycetes bacterium]|nr:class I SAM-dependent methyltransferase [Planctomycetota bacterium]